MTHCLTCARPCSRRLCRACYDLARSGDTTPMAELDAMEAEQRPTLPALEKIPNGDGGGPQDWQARPHPIRTMRTTKRRRGWGTLA